MCILVIELAISLNLREEHIEEILIDSINNELMN